MPHSGLTQCVIPPVRTTSKRETMTPRATNSLLAPCGGRASILCTPSKPRLHWKAKGKKRLGKWGGNDDEDAVPVGMCFLR